MPDLKLPRLPDRTPVKITVALKPDLAEALTDYAALYAQTYGTTEPIAELIPAMLAVFIESDRSFAKLRVRPS